MLSTLCLMMALAQDLQGQGAARVRQTALARIPLAQKIAADRELLAAVEAKNAVAESDDEIRRKDQEWMRNPAYPLRRELTTNACANRLRTLIAGDPIVVEAFLMDRRGALVCSTGVTSDYWQGDEAKWQKTYRDGKDIFLDEPALDVSSGTFAVQLSVLVSRAGSKAGALTFTLKVVREAAAGN